VHFFTVYMCHNQWSNSAPAINISLNPPTSRQSRIILSSQHVNYD